MSAADRWLVAQGSLLIVISAWSCGGRTSWAPALMLAVAAAGWLAMRPDFREGRALRRHAFVPLVLWLLLLVAALLNPSHSPGPNGWIPRASWISWLPSTVDRKTTLMAQLPWLAALMQATALIALRPAGRAVRMIWTVAAVNGFTLAAIGAMFHFAHASQMLGFIEPPESTYFFATFFYKNHWAAYGALGAVASGALALRAWRPTISGDPRARGRFLLFSAMSMLTAITLPLPGSRSGVLFAALLVLGFLAALLAQLWRERRITLRHRLVITGCVTGLLLGCIGYGANAYAVKALEDWNRTAAEVAQWKQGAPFGLRTLVSRDTARMAEARPWFGWGLGSFPIVFPVFQGDYLRDQTGHAEARFEFAHNDWLQLIAETGITGLLTLLIPTGLSLLRAWKGSGGAGRWALAGCSVILAYAWIDFPFNNPAVFVLWVILAVTPDGLDDTQSPSSNRTIADGPRY